MTAVSGMRLTFGLKGHLNRSSIVTKRCLTYKINSLEEYNEKVLRSSEPVIVSFHAKWCKPCRKLTPILVSVAESFGNVHIAKIDVEEAEDVAAKINIRTMPTVFAVKNGKVVGEIVGLQKKKTVNDFVQELVDA